MTFLNPLVLFGLLAASIPVLLHLLNLRKLKTVEFSSLMFIKELQKSKIRKLKIKQLILLLLRILIVVFIVMAFARPTVESSLPVFETYSKTSAVILIDNSFSMDVSDEKGNRFKQAKFIAREIISGLEDGDELTVIPFAESKSSQEYTLSGNLTNQLDILESIEVSVSKPKFEKVLETASNLLQNSKNLNKDIYILSDAQRNLFETDEIDSIPLPNIGIMIFKIGRDSKSKLENLSIDSLKLETRIFYSNSDVDISADIVNHSEQRADALLVNMDYNDNKVDQRTVDIEPSKKLSIELSARQEESGLTSAFVEIESDALDQDNREYFSFVIPAKPRIAIFGNNNYYLQIAFAGMQASNEVISYPSNKIQSIDLNRYDVVVMATGKFSASDYKKVKRYTENGGSAIVFANQQTDKQIFDEALLSFGFGKSTPLTSETGLEFKSVDKIHPIFEGVFKGTTNSKKIVESPKIFNAYPVKSGNSIIKIEGGSFLAESTLEQGKVLYCAVSPDIEMSTFPHTGLFPALMFRSSSYLVSGNDYGTYVTAGDEINVKLPKSTAADGRYKVIDPLGNEAFFNAVELPESMLLSFDELTQLGVYAIYDSRDEFAASVIVNADPSESELNYKNDQDIESYLKNMFGDNIGIEFIDSDVNIDEGLLRARTGSELWQIFILLALACAVAEMFVAKNSKLETE